MKLTVQSVWWKLMGMILVVQVLPLPSHSTMLPTWPVLAQGICTPPPYTFHRSFSRICNQMKEFQCWISWHQDHKSKYCSNYTIFSWCCMIPVVASTSHEINKIEKEGTRPVLLDLLQTRDPVDAKIENNRVWCKWSISTVRVHRRQTASQGIAESMRWLRRDQNVQRRLSPDYFDAMLFSELGPPVS